MEKTITVVPLSSDKVEQVRTITGSDFYVTSKRLMSELLTENLPIPNRRLAVLSILQFLEYVEYSLRDPKRSKHKRTLKIPTDRLIIYFSHTKYKKYMDLLKRLKVCSAIPYEDGTFYEKGKKCMQYRFFDWLS